MALAAAGDGLRRTAEDARNSAFFLGRLVLLRVGRDDHPLALGELASLEDRVDFFRVERFALDKTVGQALQILAALCQEILHFDVLPLHDGPNLFIDLLSGLLRVVLRALAVVAPEEDGLFLLAVCERAKLFAHAPFADHFVGDLGRLLDVIAGAGSHPAKADFLGPPPAKPAADAPLPF